MDREHGIYCYYGRLGSGKTSTMVKDLVNLLNAGIVVYANFKINWKGYDERNSLWCLLLSYLFGRSLLRHPPSNFRFMPSDQSWHQHFSRVRNCVVAIDEAYSLFDSYQMAKMPLSQRLDILQCRKRQVSIFYTTQRPTAVHVVMRAMTNVFYRCEKWFLPFITVFARDEFDLGSDESVNDDPDARLSRRFYVGTQQHFSMYDTYETIKLKDDALNAVYEEPVQLYELPRRELGRLLTDKIGAVLKRKIF